jgi:hypothetical protein
MGILSDIAFAAFYAQWQPSFFIRTHGVSTGELCAWQMVSWAVVGSLGTYYGGLLCYRFIVSNNDRASPDEAKDCNERNAGDLLDPAATIRWF